MKFYLRVLVLTALLLLTAPVLAQDGEVTLVPFSNELFGVEGVIPQGWTEAAPGVYARGQDETDITSLIVQAAPGMTAEALEGVLLQQLGIDSLPESTGTLETDAYSWTLYEIDVEQAGMSIRVDLALSESESGVTLALLQALADEHDALHEAVFLPVVEALAPAGADTGAVEGEGESQAVYEDPEGRFSVPIPANWSAEERDGYIVLSSPQGLITVSIVVVETDDPEEALENAWAVVDPDFDQQIEETLEFPTSQFEHFQLHIYEMDDEEETLVQAEVRVYEGVSYVLLVVADVVALEQRLAQIQIIDTGFEIAAMEQTDLSDVEPLPLTDDLIAEFEAYIETAMETYDTPGVAVAIVRDGEIAYANGFGVRNPEGDPVTPETLMLIGSTTKTMTTLLMAQMVDEGVMDWDTPVVDILPTFSVADPEVTGKLRMQDMVCACTGVPRRDLELFFNANELTAEGVIESLATFEFFTGVGEAFQYSNQMVAAGGYLTALAAGGEYGNLYDAYVSLVEERIFEPLKMERTTFFFEEALADEDHATPYGLYADFTTRPLPMEIEEFWLEPIAPAGAAWSNVLDLARYMIMELNEGVAADGTRIVSAENLARTWEPQVAISATDEYGLGWIVSDFHGLLMLSHGGNTLGFTADFAFLPERDLGVVVLTNQSSSLLNTAIRSRLFEMLFEQPYTAEEELQFALNLFRQQVQEALESLERTSDPEITGLVVGRFTNAALGEVTISLNDEGVPVFDAGEFQSELWLETDDEEQADDDSVTFVLYDPPLNGLSLTFEPDDEGVYQMTLGSGATEYAFERLE
ncbi:MAG: serine hydrolase domain-containing protein [Chloroflexota bacterium]